MNYDFSTIHVVWYYLFPIYMQNNKIGAFLIKLGLINGTI